MKFDDIKIFTDSQELDMLPTGKGSYVLKHAGNEVGSVYLKEGRRDDYWLELESENKETSIPEQQIKNLIDVLKSTGKLTCGLCKLHEGNRCYAYNKPNSISMGREEEA